MRLLDRQVQVSDMAIGDWIILSCVLLGCWIVFWTTMSVCGFIYSNFLAPRTDLAKRYRKGTWAAITGSSDGIGAEFAV